MTSERPSRRRRTALFDVARRPSPDVSRSREPGRGVVLWLTGLSGAGKSTVASAVYERLARAGVESELLDGDAIRALSPTGFSQAEREAHVRRVGFLASRLEHHGIVVLCALISPYTESRQWVRRLCRRFVEVHVATPLVECERRDPKGLYAAARRGELRQFTGLDAPYEPPLAPELCFNTTHLSVEESAGRVIRAWADCVGLSRSDVDGLLGRRGDVKSDKSSQILPGHLP